MGLGVLAPHRDRTPHLNLLLRLRLRSSHCCLLQSVRSNARLSRKSPLPMPRSSRVSRSICFPEIMVAGSVSRKSLHMLGTLPLGFGDCFAQVIPSRASLLVRHRLTVLSSVDISTAQCRTNTNRRHHWRQRPAASPSPPFRGTAVLERP